MIIATQKKGKGSCKVKGELADIIPEATLMMYHIAKGCTKTQEQYNDFIDTVYQMCIHELSLLQEDEEL